VVHLSELRLRIWSSWLLPSNQRLLGQRHDKLRIPQENIITWVPTLTNRCRSRIRQSSVECIPLLACWTCAQWQNPDHRAQMGSRSVHGSNVCISISHGLICIDEQMYNRSIAYHIQQPFVSLHRFVEPDATDSNMLP